MTPIAIFQSFCNYSLSVRGQEKGGSTETDRPCKISFKHDELGIFFYLSQSAISILWGHNEMELGKMSINTAKITFKGYAINATLRAEPSACKNGSADCFYLMDAAKW